MLKQCEMLELLILLTLAGACSTRDAFPERVRDELDRCCARADGCDAFDCRLYHEFRDSYRYEGLETQCREPLLYTLWPPHRARSVRFDCLAPEHFLAQLQHDIRTSEAQAMLEAKEVQFLCLVDPRAIAHPQYRDTERVLDNGSRVHEQCATTYIRGVNADLLFRYLRAAAAPAAFSEIHVRAPRRYSGVRVPCADGSRSLLTLNAADAVRRLLPELSRRQRSTLRVLAHVHGVDARAHCVLCDYRDGVPRVKMKKFETSVSVYPYHRRVTEPQRRAPPWARRDRLRARDSLWCAGYRALLALHRPQIVLEGGVLYRPRRARRCHVLALGGERVIKLVLGDTAQLARYRLPAYALHVQLRWAAAPARWKPESVSVVRVGAAVGTRRRLARARWLPRRRAYYARALTLRASAGHYLTIDTLGVEYFEDGTPERFSRSIDGKLDTDGDLTDVDWSEGHLPAGEEKHPHRIRQGNHNVLTMPTRTTLSRTVKVDTLNTETVDLRKFITHNTHVNKSSACATIEEKQSAAETTALTKLSILTANAEKLSTTTKVDQSCVFSITKKYITAANTTDVNKSSVQIITNVDKSSALTTNVDKTSLSTTNATKLIDVIYKLRAQAISPEITNIGALSTQTRDAYNKPIKLMSPETTCVQVTNTAMTTASVVPNSLAKLNEYLNMSKVKLTEDESLNSKTGKPDRTPWKIAMTICAIVLLVILAGVSTICLARYGWCPCWGYKERKALHEAGPGAVAAAAAVSEAGRDDATAAGPLDVVVQSLVVAQGVTIAVAARMLWHMWHANHAAAAGAPVAAIKVP